MYNHAPRDTNLVNSQTPRNVGPSTYMLPDGRDGRVNVVPFLSSRKKTSSIYGKAPSEAFYDLPDTVRSAKGGSTPRDRAPRFVTKISDTPAPGDYDPKIQGKYQRKVPSTVRPKKLYVCSMPYSVKGCAPSMPLDPFGYYLDENESLVKIPPTKRDLTLGPAYYHVPYRTCDPNKGCKWSGRTGQRSFYKIELGPGPAAYNVEFYKCQRRTEEEEFREMARRFGFVPRYLEAQELKCRKEGLPGPGQYDVRTRDICKACPSAKPRPFICGSKRFAATVSENPGPGQYNSVTVKYAVSKKNVPFSLEASRFSKTKVIQSPGPAYYDVKSPLMEKILQKKNPYALFEPPFCTTAKRKTLAVNPDAAKLPSPADYYKDVQGHCKILVSSVFKSKTIRFKRLCMKNEVSPATYNITDAFKRNRAHASFQAFEVSFNTTAKRKGIIEKTKSPGPADYCSQGDLSQKGHYIPVSPRFQDEDPDAPGPGTYFIHPSYDNSLYKASKTFNLHIKESVLRKKLRRSPQETWGKWAAGLKKKKRLKAFILN